MNRTKNYYQVTIACYTRETITVCADSLNEAKTIAVDVFREKSGYAAVKEATLEINLLKQPIDKGYLAPVEPTVRKSIKLR